MSAVSTDPTVRRQVLATARRLVAVDHRASVSRIAAEAGVSRATFYRQFGSRRALLRELNLEAPPDARQRVLEAAAEMLLRQPLAELSMDDLAAAAGVSRATLYRTFSGKAQLLGGLIEAYAPFQDAMDVLERRGAEPPEEVLPELARSIVRSALPRFAVVRAILIEATSGSTGNLPGIRPVLQRALGAMAAYLAAQMDAGRLRRMDPILALQATMGPIAFHMLTRPLAGQVMNLDVEPDRAVDQIIQATLHGLLVP
ncbi:MAG: TetR/AcrR family transcriptional regulator [Candidatus Limnocylindria bacterium]